VSALKKVVIVGAGPAGLMAAHELSGKAQVTIVEKRGFVGGSGLHSDGKLNFHPRIGGDLTQFMGEEEAWSLIGEVKQVFTELGVEMAPALEEGLRDLEARAAKSGIRFVRIEQNHIGSDYLPGVMERMRAWLEERGVRFLLETEATKVVEKDGRAVGVETTAGVLDADAVLLAPGRIGNNWLIEELGRLGIPMRFNPIDIGVRVEVPDEVMEEVIHGCKVWDPKFHMRTPSYDDFARTFCVCPSGFVVREHYGDGLFGANGHSMKDTKSGNTNFALLIRVSLTQPLENTTSYGRAIVQLANTLGGHKPLIQRLGDLRRHRRSTWQRIDRSHVAPTLRDVTPGDISMAYPQRTLTDLLEALDMLDKVMPGVSSDSTLLYAPEVKFYAMRIATDHRLATKVPGLYVAGDGAGLSRGIVGAAATGIVAARGILSEIG